MDSLSSQDYLELHNFRHLIRQFLHFSEEAAREAGLEPRQHQILLAVRALSAQSGHAPTIGMLAEGLLVKHHSAVGLIDRLEGNGLVERERSGEDHRQVRVKLTATGNQKLAHLSATHREELRHIGPELVEALRAVLERPEKEHGGDFSDIKTAG